MKILTFKKFEKNTLRGFLQVETPSGMVIKNITWHQKNGKEWLGLPAREYTKEDGSKGYSNVVDFTTKDLYWDFVNSTLDALKEYQEKANRP